MMVSQPSLYAKLTANYTCLLVISDMQVGNGYLVNINNLTAQADGQRHVQCQ